MITLDIALLETFNPTIIAIADVSKYPPGAAIESPSLEITPPGFSRVILQFVPRQVNLFNSETLGLTHSAVTPQPLPDGIWKIRYSIRPHYEVFVQRTILRIDGLKQRFDLAFLKTLEGCLPQDLLRKQRRRLDEVSMLLQAAVAASNQCNEKLAMDLFSRARKILEKCNC